MLFTPVISKEVSISIFSAWKFSFNKSQTTDPWIVGVADLFAL